jgi:hypothetical protein
LCELGLLWWLYITKKKIDKLMQEVRRKAQEGAKEVVVNLGSVWMNG